MQVGLGTPPEHKDNSCYDYTPNSNRLEGCNVPVIRQGKFACPNHSILSIAAIGGRIQLE